ncbi:MAG: LemA family protein [Pseudomonadales bacterium]|nr:LemA family protein [Pseudomonadales bacterium]
MEFLVILAVVAILLIWVVAIYNKLVALKNRFQNAFAQIDVQLKRRYDLIPNLVETVKAYLTHERETLEAVIRARNTAVSAAQAAAASPGDPGAMQALSGAEGALGGAMIRLNAVMEAYPDLKANQNISQLTEELTSTENRIAFARQSYNDQVMTYNTYRQSFPPVVFAGLFGHGSDAGLLEFQDREAIQTAPRVSFS